MKVKYLLTLLITLIVLFPISQAFSQLEGIVINSIKVGKTALDIEISDGKAYVTNPEEGTIVVIDVNSGKVIKNIQAVQGVGIIEIVKEKNKIYASALENPKIFVYNLETGEKINEIDIGEPNITLYSKADKPYGQREYVTFNTNAIGLAYNPNNELLYAVHSTVNHVNYIDTNTDTNLGDIPVGTTPLLIQIDKTRDIGYVTNWESNDVSVLDLKSNQEIKKLATGFVPDQLAIDENNNRLFVSHHASPHITVIDLRNQEIETKIDVGGPSHSLALDSNRSILHVSATPTSPFTGVGSTGVVKLINTKTNKVINSMDLKENPFMVAIDSQDDKLLGTNIASGTVLTADLKKEAELLGYDKPETTQTTKTGGGCLIATATYGSELAPQVQHLRELRDNTLLKTETGTTFMKGFNDFYYSFSPSIADLERENPVFKELVKVTITPMISSLSILNYVNMDSDASVLGYGLAIIGLNIGMYFVAPAIVIIKLRKRI